MTDYLPPDPPSTPEDAPDFGPPVPEAEPVSPMYEQYGIQSYSAQQAAPVKAKTGRGRVLVAGLAGLFFGAALGIAASTLGLFGGNQTPQQVVVAQQPSNYDVTVDGAVVSLVAQGATPSITVDIYFDYMCPYCGMFERANHLDLEDYLNAGDIKLSLHAMSFLDDASNGTKYSTRSANDALAVASQAPENYLAFHDALFESQPQESTNALSDADLADLATRAGVPQSVIDGFTAMEFESAVAAGTQTAFNENVSGTPTVLLNGTKFEGDMYTRGGLREAIAALR
ncbi:MAG: thioredoxin domain-containing protein [Propionibacteriaceae bacterium]|jgi:protein-disulfide isomerase|nr:thioredoxin domain-containing protein [Propionibacteriaceae bacterium]